MVTDKYDQARKDFQEWANVDENLIPFEFGKVGAKGISDLDLGVIVKDSLKVNLENHLKSFPISTLDIMNGGTITIFAESTFRNILYIDNIDINFFGETLYFKKPSSKEIEIINIIQIIEWLPERILCIYKDLEKGFPNLNKSLGYLYSLCYSLKKIQSLDSKNALIDSFINEVYQLRFNWLVMNKELKIFNLNSLVSKSLSILKVSVDLFVKFPLIKDLSNQINDQKEISFNLHSNVFIKSADNNDYKVSKDSFLNNITIHLPNLFLYTYFKYSRNKDSYLSSILAKRIEYKYEDKDFYIDNKILNEIIKKRFEFMDECFEFIKKLNLRSGLYKFGWYI